MRWMAWRAMSVRPYQPLTSTRASQMASLARTAAMRVEVTSVQDHTRDSTEKVRPPSRGTTSSHGAQSRTNSYTAAPPAAHLQGHPEQAIEPRSDMPARYTFGVVTARTDVRTIFVDSS